MSDSEISKLKAQIQDLESEVEAREADLKRYRDELVSANSQLEVLIAQIRQELSITKKIQKVLVPTEFPNFPGFEMSYKFLPSKISGGDYYDLFEHKDRLRFGVIVASASGHSMSAILLTVLLKLTHQMESKKGAKPHEILGAIGSEMQSSAGDSDLADIFYGFIDRRSYTLSYSVLGEVAVYLKDGKTKEIKPLVVNSGPLAKNFNEKIETRKIKLNPHDMLVAVTQGITNSPNLEGEVFGKERLVEAIMARGEAGVHEVRNHIFHSVSQFCSGTEVSRDQTVIVLEVKDKVIRLA
jgi:sigma-B regulation protein RsbU (phosphoserine phosphatase)